MPQSSESGCAPGYFILDVALANPGAAGQREPVRHAVHRGHEVGVTRVSPSAPSGGYARLRGGGTTRSRGSRAVDGRAPRRPRSLVSARITPLRLEAFDQLPKACTPLRLLGSGPRDPRPRRPARRSGIRKRSVAVDGHAGVGNLWSSGHDGAGLSLVRASRRAWAMRSTRRHGRCPGRTGFPPRRCRPMPCC